MIYVLLVPIVLQILAMVFDEFYYHWKRGLPKWERVGHPIDTMSVISCFALTVFFEFSINNLAIYLGLALFSSLLVTKDEFVHAECCEPAESWLHSVLFVLHPLVLLSMGFGWWLSSMETSVWPVGFLNSLEIGPDHVQFFLQTQLIMITLFFFYQTIYWNFYDQRHRN